MAQKQPEVADHAMREKRHLHPNDELLREHGFRVHSRPNGREATWSRGGTVYGETDALGVCYEEEDGRT